MFTRLTWLTGGAMAVLAAALGAIAQPARAASPAPECGVGQLSFRFYAGSPGAGQQYATLVLTNRSHITCRTGGYIGLGLENAKGRPVATHVRRNPGHVSTIVLKPGAKANTFLHWTDVDGTGDVKGGPCFTAPAKLLITPPDSFTSFHTVWPYGPVCLAGSISVTPLTAGAHITDPA